MAKRRFNYGSSAPSRTTQVVQGGTGTAVIPQYDTDPASPAAEDAWVLRTVGSTDGVAGQPRGLLLTLTYTGIATSTDYQFSYRTQEGTTVRTTLA